MADRGGGRLRSVGGISVSADDLEEETLGDLENNGRSFFTISSWNS